MYCTTCHECGGPLYVDGAIRFYNAPLTEDGYDDSEGETEGMGDLDVHCLNGHTTWMHEPGDALADCPTPALAETEG